MAPRMTTGSSSLASSRSYRPERLALCMLESSLYMHEGVKNSLIACVCVSRVPAARA